MERLNPLDAQFVDAEDQDRNASFAIASIAVFEGPAPTYEEFLEAITRRLPRVPLYRRKLRTVPLRLGPPVWVDDPNFDIRYHVRQTALPAPGHDAQLRALMARVMSQRLDRDYPLWEYWLVLGLSRGRWALISKIHHCMVDGISGTDLYRAVFDTSPALAEPGGAAGPGGADGLLADAGAVPAEPGVPAVPEVPAEPASLELAARAAADLAALPVRSARVIGDALASPGRTARQISETARALARLAPSAMPATSSSLLGPIGRQRRYTWARASLNDVKAIKAELGGTVNDVVLTAITGGFRALLLARGEDPQPHMVPSLVPVSMRAPGEESIYENRVSILMAYLPVHLADPVERLAAVRAELSDLKASKEATVGETLVALGRYTPYPLASLSVRLAYLLPQREIATVTTNVPGPTAPLYALGRKLIEIIPYVPIATRLRTGISIFSYCGQLTFGITGDYGSTPDLEVLARGIEDDLAGLMTVAGLPGPAKPTRRR